MTFGCIPVRLELTDRQHSYCHRFSKGTDADIWSCMILLRPQRWLTLRRAVAFRRSRPCSAAFQLTHPSVDAEESFFVVRHNFAGSAAERHGLRGTVGKIGGLGAVDVGQCRCTRSGGISRVRRLRRIISCVAAAANAILKSRIACFGPPPSIGNGLVDPLADCQLTVLVVSLRQSM